jgi:hypothetical protein
MLAAELDQMIWYIARGGMATLVAQRRTAVNVASDVGASWASQLDNQKHRTQFRDLLNEVGRHWPFTVRLVGGSFG